MVQEKLSGHGPVELLLVMLDLIDDRLPLNMEAPFEPFWIRLKDHGSSAFCIV